MLAGATQAAQKPISSVSTHRPQQLKLYLLSARDFIRHGWVQGPSL